MTSTTLTRTDCTRDNVAVICPNATLLGFGTHKSKRGYWLEYERDDNKRVGRVIGRVTCEGKVYIEIAVVSLAFSAVHVQWVEPCEVREIRRSPPRAVFAFLGQDEWKPDAVFKAMEYGVSDMRDQLDAREND
jgi:hypothetical protein